MIDFKHFLKTARVNDTMQIEISKNILVWLDKYQNTGDKNLDFCLELQFLDDKGYYTDRVINKNYYLDKEKELESIATEYQKEIDKLGIDNFLEKHKEELL